MPTLEQQFAEHARQQKEWNTTHEQNDAERFVAIENTQDDIKGMLVELKMLHEKLDKKMEPAAAFLLTLNNMNRFLKWGGLTLFGTLAILYWLIKR